MNRVLSSFSFFAVNEGVQGWVGISTPFNPPKPNSILVHFGFCAPRFGGFCATRTIPRDAIIPVCITYLTKQDYLFVI
jgi:hypothetical protein